MNAITTIEQTVDIPVDHQLVVSVSPEVPAGRTIISFTPAGFERSGAQTLGHNAEYLKRKAREPHDLELINHHAEHLNAEALDVLSYQNLDV